jgi:octaprenyl-diphosphate synthase
MGAAVGRPEHGTALAGYGHALGMAFQVADDLLDYTGAESVLGKPSGQDVREHKVTLPLIHALRQMGGTERREVERFFAQPVPDEDGVRRVVELVEANGGLEYAERKAEAYGEQAAAALESLPEGEPTDLLREAIRYVIDRRR